MLLLLVLSITGVLLFGFGFVVGCKYQTNHNRIRSGIRVRVAAHEVGHAIVAWRSPQTLISFIEMDDGPTLGSGRVRLKMDQSDYLKSLWWDLAITLGGLVGELVEMKKFRSGNCMSDLVIARNLITSINQSGGHVPPWKPVLSKGSFDITGLYRTGALSTAEEAILRQAYAKARWIIEHDRARFDLLARHLLAKGRLEEADVENLLR